MSTDKYICHQCGADENGGEIHSLTHHSLMMLTVKEAKRFLRYPCEGFAKGLCICSIRDGCKDDDNLQLH